MFQGHKYIYGHNFPISKELDRRELFQTLAHQPTRLIVPVRRPFIENIVIRLAPVKAFFLKPSSMLRCSNHSAVPNHPPLNPARRSPLMMYGQFLINRHSKPER